MFIINSEQRAYIAGIIDGEGSIMLIKFHKNQQPSPCISISSTTLELLEWIKDVSGVGSIIHKKNYNTIKHKESYTYIVKYRDALVLLNEISEFLVIIAKKKRAELIINEYENVTLRNGRYSESMLKKKLQFYKDFMAIK